MLSLTSNLSRCDSDGTVNRTEKTTSRLRFNFEGFQFLSSSTNAIYLHCQVKSCASSCTVNCGGSRKRRSIYDADVLHVGTVKINVHPDAGKFSSLRPPKKKTKNKKTKNKK